jgi:hypothetical protein
MMLDIVVPKVDVRIDDKRTAGDSVLNLGEIGFNRQFRSSEVVSTGFASG